MKRDDLVDLLDRKVEQYNKADFIQEDPIIIPHRFQQKQDIEIMAFFAASLAWGQRKTIIKKCLNIVEIFENKPFQFITQHTDSDLKKCEHFVHRTFNGTDFLYFISFLKYHFQQYDSLESAFCLQGSTTQKERLANFQKYFFSLPFAPDRTQKHVATPLRNSACKRINMFLRWMVRKDNKGVDFGIWNDIPMSDLICPLDVHVDRVARKLNLLSRKQTDWRAAVELTEKLSELDIHDPVKYDFALFGLGLEGFGK